MLDYALTTILSMVSLTDNEVHPIAFHSCTFMPPKLNYDVHDKELLAIFEAFKIWHHYLEGSLTPINVVMDHKTLSISPLLSYSPVAKSAGWNFSVSSTSPFVSAPATWAPSLTHEMMGHLP